MKKLIVAFAILSCFTAYSQPFVGMNATTKGIGLSVGFLAEKGLQAEGGYRVNLVSTLVPDLFYATLGQRITISNYDEDNFSVTPSAGAALCKFKEVVPGYRDLVSVSTVKPYYGVEIGKDWYIGRLSVYVNRCDGFFFGIGIKAFIK